MYLKVYLRPYSQRTFNITSTGLDLQVAIAESSTAILEHLELRSEEPSVVRKRLEAVENLVAIHGSST